MYHLAKKSERCIQVRQGQAMRSEELSTLTAVLKHLRASEQEGTHAHTTFITIYK